MRKGFSLVELLVVIAVLASLAAIAVPVYKNHIIKAKIISAMNILLSINTHLLKEFEVNKLGNSSNFGTVTLLNGANVVYTAPPVERTVYYTGSSGIPASNLFVCVYISGLEAMVPSSGAAYVAPSSSATGSRNRLCIYNVPSNGAIVPYCGIWTTNPALGGDLYLPPEFLPKGCDCSALNTGTC